MFHLVNVYVCTLHIRNSNILSIVHYFVMGITLFYRNRFYKMDELVYFYVIFVGITNSLLMRIDHFSHWTITNKKPKCNHQVTRQYTEQRAIRCVNCVVFVCVVIIWIYCIRHCFVCDAIFTQSNLILWTSVLKCCMWIMANKKKTLITLN